MRWGAGEREGTGRQEGERMKYEGERDKWEEMIGRPGERDEGERRVEKWEMRRRGLETQRGTGVEGRLGGRERGKGAGGGGVSMMNE